MKNTIEESYKKARDYLVLKFGKDWYEKLSLEDRFRITKKIAAKIRKAEEIYGKKK